MFCGNINLPAARAHFETKTAEKFNGSAGANKLRLIFNDVVSSDEANQERYHFAAKQWKDLTFFEWAFSTLLFFKVDVQINGQKVTVALNAQSVRKRLGCCDLDNAAFHLDQVVADLQNEAQGFYFDEKGKKFFVKEKGVSKVYVCAGERRIGKKRIIDLIDPKNETHRVILAVSDAGQGVDEAPLYKLFSHPEFYHNMCKPYVWGRDEGRRYALYDLDEHAAHLRASARRRVWPRHTRIMDAVFGVWDVHQMACTLGKVIMLQLEGREFVFDLSQVEKGINPKREREDILQLGKHLRSLLDGKEDATDCTWPLERIIEAMCAKNPELRPSMREVVTYVSTWQALKAIEELQPYQMKRVKTIVMQRGPYDKEGLLALRQAIENDKRDCGRRLFIAVDTLWKLAS